MKGRRSQYRSWRSSPQSIFVVSLRGGQDFFEPGEGQTLEISIPVDRNGNIGYPGQVQFGISGIGENQATEADFGGTYPSDFISFGGNDLTSNIVLTIYGNNAIDGDRTFVVSLHDVSTTGGSGQALVATSSIVCTIIDDDAPLPTTFVTYNNNDVYYNGNPVEM